MISTGIAAQIPSDTIITGQAAVVPFFTDFIYLKENRFYQDIYFDSIANENKSKIHISVHCYFRKPDSTDVLVYRKISERSLSAKQAFVTLPYGKGNKEEDYVLPSFSDVMKATTIVPPGLYTMVVNVKSDDKTYTDTILRTYDTLLPVHAPIRKQFLAFMESSTKQKGNGKLNKENASSLFKRSERKTEKFFNGKGYQSKQYQNNNKEVIDLNRNGWFIGRFEIPSKAAPAEFINKEQLASKHHISGSIGGSNLESHRSVFSRFREIQQNNKDPKEITGEIGLMGSAGNAQEEFSEWDNNFYELRGQLDFPIMGIPVNLNGFYTSQDKNRDAKASFIHLRYDSEKAKQQMGTLLGGYKSEYQKATTMGSNYEMLYGNYKNELQSQKGKLTAELLKELGNNTGVDASNLSKETLEQALKNEAIEQAKEQSENLSNSSDTTTLENDSATISKKERLDKSRKSAEEKYERVMKRYEQQEALEKKIAHYEKLLSQYKKTNYYDSLVAYDKMKDVQQYENMTYKEMAKTASGILPEGKAKNALNGLTSFDVGMFPKHTSDYTMGGQMMKGVDAGYDVKYAVIGASMGRTDYIDRSGNVESYNVYSGRVNFKPVLKQELGLIYYSYSPGRGLSSDNFFENGKGNKSGYLSPVNIVSGTYKGNIAKYVSMQSEYAYSDKQNQYEVAAKTQSVHDKSAWNMNVTGNIPYQDIMIEAGYEHAGKDFENNTLPVIMAGTDRLRLRGSGMFFNSFLKLGVEYNYLIQNNLYSTGNNTRWGFDIATQSKRYPSFFLSYKPFSTFRSFNDTLNIEQKPLLGEVWTGRVNYQIKRGDKAIRFTLLYTSNNSIMDSIRYGSSLWQFSTIYTIATTMFNVNIGSTRINTNYIETSFPAFNNSNFINVMASGNLLEHINTSGGLDVAYNEGGLCKYGIMATGMYRFIRIPFAVRLLGRYGNYKMIDAGGWKPMYNGSLELIWNFKTSLSKRA